MSKKIRARKPKFGEISDICVEGEGWVEKKKIIERIRKGEKFNVNGTSVNVVPNPPREGKYLRTDNNQLLSDNLGELPDNC